MCAVINRNRWLLGFSGCVYFIGVVLGFFLPDPSFSVFEKPTSHSAMDYIWHNLFVSFQMCLGIFTLGVYPFLLLVGNGMIVGMTIDVNLEHDSFFQVFAQLVPHGIFEVPGTVIAASVGFKGAEWVLYKVLDRKVSVLKDCLFLSVLMIFLIITGGIMEAVVTPRVSNYFIVNFSNTY